MFLQPCQKWLYIWNPCAVFVLALNVTLIMMLSQQMRTTSGLKMNIVLMELHSTTVSPVIMTLESPIKLFLMLYTIRGFL